MGRLSLSPSRSAFTDRRLKPATELAAPTPVRGSQPWKAWYKTKRWQELKLLVHIRDNYTCQRTGRVCGGKYPSPDSPVANHKRPHRGNPALFWDPDNVETVTKAVHDSAIQSEEQASLHTRGVWD